MYSAKEIAQQFVEQTKGTSDFRSFLEEAFESIEELNRQQAIHIIPVGPIGMVRVKECS